MGSKMDGLAYSELTGHQTFTLEEVLQLEEEEKLLRVLQPDVLERVKQCLATSGQKIEPFIVECNGAIYFSFLNITNAEQRRQTIRKVQQWQTGVDVDLSDLPRPLHQLLQPHRAFSQRLMRGLVLGGIAGTIAGVLAMAVSILVIPVAEPILGTTLDVFGEMQITAVTFVIFAVLGWMIATPFFWNRLSR
jgi:hypothetical protein